MIEAINEYYIDNGKLRKLEEWREEGEGKLIYEVIRIINGKPLFYKEHYDRMINSFKLNNYKNDITYDEVLNDINNLVKSNNKTLGNIKIIFNTKSNEFKIFFIKETDNIEFSFGNLPLHDSIKIEILLIFSPPTF